MQSLRDTQNDRKFHVPIGECLWEISINFLLMYNLAHRIYQAIISVNRMFVRFLLISEQRSNMDQQTGKTIMKTPLSTCSNLNIASLIVAAVSAFYGGFPLTLVAIILAFISLRKYYNLDESEKPGESIRRSFEQRLKIAMIIAVVVFFLNLISFFYMLPAIMQMYDALMNGTIPSDLINSSATSSSHSINWG